MASRFPNARPGPANSLFSAYDAQTRPKSNSPAFPSAQHPKKSDDHHPPRSSSSAANPAFGAYPGSSSSSSSNPYAATAQPNGSALGPGSSGSEGHYRTATPNKRGQYSDAVLNELESQNDDELAGLTGKVRMLKDLTTAIGDEIRSSSSLADAMNESFENTRVRLRGTWTRMLAMAERTGVGWKVWVGFFALVWCLFFYVWLF